MHITPRDTGWVEVITGCMFSGKTEELIRRLNRAQYARQKVLIFKPRIDKRYSQDSVVSHSKQELVAIAIDDANDIIAHALDAEVIGIDEAQFFGPALVPVVERLANAGKRVVVAGLDQDYLGRPFDPMPHLMAIAEYVTKNLAICVRCGNPADRSQRLVR
ncbi:MAG TPA: thymidine kinase, partial [Polyangiaceae bacterium]|nr:thymidine kinase [Polyangiaceae bacterium]